MPQDQKDELSEWLGTSDEKEHIKSLNEEFKWKKNSTNQIKPTNKLRKKLKNAIKTTNEQHTIISALVRYEENKKTTISPEKLRHLLGPDRKNLTHIKNGNIGLSDASPATTIKLQTFLKNQE